MVSQAGQGGRLISGPSPFPLFALGSLLVYLLFILALFLALLFMTDPASLVEALLSSEIRFALRLSLATATASALLSLVVAIPAAYALSRTSFFGKSLVDALLDLPLVLPPIAVGLTLLVFFRTPVGQAIEGTGLHFVFTPLGIILAQFTLVSTFALRLMKASFDSIDPRYEGVARTLGCGPAMTFWRVSLPLARNGIFAAAVLTWARAMGDFGATVVFVGATPFKTETLPIAIWLNLATLSLEKAVAVALILLAMSLVALLGFRLIGERGLRL